MPKINVLQFICPTGFYGAEMWILALAKNLDREKINCQLAITRESEDQNIEIYDRFRALGLDAHKIKMNGRFDPVTILKLVRLIKRERIDIIHTHGYKSDILGLMAARLAGIKVIATPHGFGNVKDVKLELFMRFGRFALKYFDRVAPLSEELESEMVKIKVPYRNMRLILNAVDLEEIELQRRKVSERDYFNSKDKNIVHIGRMDTGKNIIDLIESFDLLYKVNTNIRLILIGDGPLKKVLKKKARSKSSGEKIEFLGYRNDRLKLLKECDLFSMTASSEGIPRCLMEAMAMGIPVAAYRIPGVDKLIIHEKTGLMADFGKVEDLKKCWERLLFDGKFSANISQNGRKHIIESFSAKRMAEEYMNLYQEMVKVG